MSGYDDIINLPRPALKKHSRMPVSERAAQFAPFAALAPFQAITSQPVNPAAKEGREEDMPDDSGIYADE